MCWVRWSLMISQTPRFRLNEETLPWLLMKAGYKNALFGKFHLGLQGQNPFRFTMPSALGWDYFYGWLDSTGDPSSIDTTAGLGDGDLLGGASYACGFVPGADQENGADSGACYAACGSCEDMFTSDGVPRARPGLS